VCRVVATHSTLIVCVYIHSNNHPRSSKVVNFGKNRKHVRNFLSMINNNLYPIFPVWKILQVLCWRQPRIPRELWWCSLVLDLPILALPSVKTLGWCIVTVKVTQPTGWPKKLAPFLYALTLSNISRFSDLFHCQNQEKICNNTMTKVYGAVCGCQTCSCYVWYFRFHRIYVT